MKAAIVGVPLDLGAGRRGVDMGPSAIRYAGLEERLSAIGVDCVDRSDVAAAVAEATRIPIVLGGDHSIALGPLGGLASRRGPGAVLWFDARGDLNTPETTTSGNVQGMPLAAALGA